MMIDEVDYADLDAEEREALAKTSVELDPLSQAFVDALAVLMAGRVEGDHLPLGARDQPDGNAYTQ